MTNRLYALKSTNDISGSRPTPRDGQGADKRGKERLLHDLGLTQGQAAPTGQRASGPASATDGAGEPGPSKLEVTGGNALGVFALVVIAAAIVAALWYGWTAASNRGDLFIGVAWTVATLATVALAALVLMGEIAEDLFGRPDSSPDADR